MDFVYGNKVLRAVPEVKENGRRTLWFPAKDLEAITGNTLKRYDLERAELRPGIDYKIVNTNKGVNHTLIQEPNWTNLGNPGRRGNPNRLVLSDSGLFQVVYGGRTKFAKQFRWWITDEVWPAVFHDGMYITPDGHPMQDLVDEVKRLSVGLDELRAQNELLRTENKVLWEHTDMRLGDLAGGGS